MYLLNAKTKKLQAFFNSDIPVYAILSHTWGSEEVTFDEVQNYGSFRRIRQWNAVSRKAGWKKVDMCCRQATRDHIEWVWIDTCCIDKKSSAELSEAINSMFGWYRGSTVCYVYLADVSTGRSTENGGLVRHGPTFRFYSLTPHRATADLPFCTKEFGKSRWFTRGWTLQELIGPCEMAFFNEDWRFITSKIESSYLLETVTNIPQTVLVEVEDENTFSVAEKMSWASNRTTSREEDMAYCMLGLCNVNMPLLYGEGDKAFVRLQEAIMHSIYDHSILAWGYGLCCKENVSQYALAAKPASFRGWQDTCITRSPKGNHYSMTNSGILVELPVISLETSGSILNPPGAQYGLLILDCFTTKDGLAHEYMALPIYVLTDFSTQSTPSKVPAGGFPSVDFRLVSSTSTKFVSRALSIAPFLIPTECCAKAVPTTVYIGGQEHAPFENFILSLSFSSPYKHIDFDSLQGKGWTLFDFFPPSDCPWSDTSVRIRTETLFRFRSESGMGNLLVWIKKNFQGLATHTRDAATSWEHILGPSFERFDFDRLAHSFEWDTDVVIGEGEERLTVFIRPHEDHRGSVRALDLLMKPSPVLAFDGPSTNVHIL